MVNADTPGTIGRIGRSRGERCEGQGGIGGFDRPVNLSGIGHVEGSAPGRGIASVSRLADQGQQLQESQRLEVVENRPDLEPGCSLGVECGRLGVKHPLERLARLAVDRDVRQGFLFRLRGKVVTLARLNVGNESSGERLGCQSRACTQVAQLALAEVWFVALLR
jgi:hypothetical protein